jgi:hypothetical protein
MRGKSMTCRKRAIFLTVSDRFDAVIDREIEKESPGKSETCRASEWQSHTANSFSGHYNN